MKTDVKKKMTLDAHSTSAPKSRDNAGEEIFRCGRRQIAVFEKKSR